MHRGLRNNYDSLIKYLLQRAGYVPCFYGTNEIDVSMICGQQLRLK